MRILCVFALIGAAMLPAPAQEPGREGGGSLEYEVKAAFLYNFARFTDWPAYTSGKPNGSIVIGVLGEDPFGRALDAAIRGKTVRGRPMEVRRFPPGSRVEPCDILFISRSEEKRLAAVLSGLAGQPVLTVGESRNFSRQGGVIGFKLEANKVRFEVNVDAAGRAGLKVSSKLLSLAEIVRDGDGGME